MINGKKQSGNDISQFKVRSLPSIGIANSIYFLLTNNDTVQQFITDEQGRFKLVVSGNVIIATEAGVTSVNGVTGEVVLTTDQIPEGIINKYFSSLRAITALSGQNISLFTNDVGYITSSGGGSNFTYYQSIPNSIWVVLHNLGYHPSVTVVDSADSVVVGSIHYNNINQLTITFVGGFSGKAYLS